MHRHPGAALCLRILRREIAGCGLFGQLACARGAVYREAAAAGLPEPVDVAVCIPRDLLPRAPKDSRDYAGRLTLPLLNLNDQRKVLPICPV